MAKMISLTIDGRPVSVPEGTLIVNAAKQIGVDIPVFCFHPKMEPVGMCRQCLVEVGRPMFDRATGQAVLENGRQKIQFGAKLETACSTPVSAGMVVLSTSEKALASQKEILEFLLTSHPLDCPVCDKGGECPLQNLTMAHASGWTANAASNAPVASAFRTRLPESRCWAFTNVDAPRMFSPIPSRALTRSFPAIPPIFVRLVR
jgi:NADH-quinone oxidoreductase subunit G